MHIIYQIRKKYWYNPLYTTCIQILLLYSVYGLVVREFATTALEFYNPGSNPTKVMTFKVEECNEPSCEALIFPYGVVLFNIFSTICI